MFCTNCGKEIKVGVRFCKSCGTETSTSQSFLKGIIPKARKKLGSLLWQKIIIIVVGGSLIGATLLVIYSLTLDNNLPAPTVETPKRKKDEIIASVVNIICPLSNQKFSIEVEGFGGSGTIIDSIGIIITNAHVIPSDVHKSGCFVVLPDPKSGLPNEIYVGNPKIIPELSDTYDLAFIEIYDVYTDPTDGFTYGSYPKDFPAFDDSQYICSGEEVKLGETVTIYGYPQASGGYSLTITEGVVSSFSEEGFLFTSAKIDTGNSGGLAVDKDGCMIGIPSMVSIGEYENLGVIISTNLIVEFFEQVETILEKPEGEFGKQIIEEQYPEIYPAKPIKLVGNELLRSCPDFQCEVILWGTADGIAIVKETKGEWYRVEVFEYGQIVSLDEYPYIKVVKLTNPIIVGGWFHKTPILF